MATNRHLVVNHESTGDISGNKKVGWLPARLHFILILSNILKYKYFRGGRLNTLATMKAISSSSPFWERWIRLCYRKWWLEAGNEWERRSDDGKEKFTQEAQGKRCILPHGLPAWSRINSPHFSVIQIPFPMSCCSPMPRMQVGFPKAVTWYGCTQLQWKAQAKPGICVPPSWPKGFCLRQKVYKLPYVYPHRIPLTNYLGQCWIPNVSH